MIDHLVIIETRSGCGELFRIALADIDCRRDPCLIRLSGFGTMQPKMSCHNVFLAACEQLRDFMAERRVRPSTSRVVAVVDSVDLLKLDPLKSTGKYDIQKSGALISLLILAFPEVFWGFANLDGTSDREMVFMQHYLDSWHRGNGFRVPPIEPLMDVTGLRDHVRILASVTLRENGDKRPNPVQLREQWAVALDDESSYAYFNAYTEYRHGFRSAPLSSWTAAKYLLSRDDVGRLQPMVSFEDVYMSFPDVPNRQIGPVRLADLDQRDTEFPRLKKITHRIILTSGARREETPKLTQDIEYRKAERLLKPIGGMFSIWEMSGLRKILSAKDPQGQCWIGGYAPGYHPGTAADPLDKGERHSAPGALLSVAEILLERATQTKRDFTTVEDAILAAVLATDAYEVLASRTPTLSLDALILKHEMEVKAECCFNGVQNHFDVRGRRKRIEKAVMMLSKWFAPWHQDVARWNSEAAVIARLKSVFREYEQFDEELIYISYSRTLHRRLWFRQLCGTFFSLPLGWIGSFTGKVFGTWLRYVNPIYIGAGYVGVLLRSIPTFLIALLIWMGGLTYGFYLIEQKIDEGSPRAVTHSQVYQNRIIPKYLSSVSLDDPLPRAIGDAFSCMVGVGAPLRGDVIENDTEVRHWYNLLTCFGMGLGFLHLGILVSHLYSIVSRR